MASITAYQYWNRVRLGWVVLSYSQNCSKCNWGKKILILKNHLNQISTTSSVQFWNRQSKYIFIVFHVSSSRAIQTFLLYMHTLAAPHFFYAHLFILFKGCKIWHLTISLSDSVYGERIVPALIFIRIHPWKIRRRNAKNS